MKPLRARDIVLGSDTLFDAWLYSMLMDNNLAYSLNPHLIASQEQLGFMVQRENQGLYLPCSDATFALLGEKDRNGQLQKQYNRAWRIICRLIRQSIPDRPTRSRIFQFCRLRFNQYTAQRTLLPSRLVKRMTDLVLKQSFSPLEDPWKERRKNAVRKHQELMQSEAFQKTLDTVSCDLQSRSITCIRQRLNSLEIIRLFCLTVMARDWENHPPNQAQLQETLRKAEDAARDFLPLLSASSKRQCTILYLADGDGSVFFDLMSIQALIHMGHRVVYAVKDEFFFYAPTLDDLSEDPVLEKYLGNAKILRESNISKNALLKELKANDLLIISDGTRERLNLYRVSVTFARAWKESDVIVCHGWRARDIFLNTSSEFTRDIVCFWKNEDAFQIALRKHAANSHKFSERDIKEQAGLIIQSMRNAHKAKRAVIFYSCIIGSLPGQTSQAIELAKTFVEHLRKKLDNVLIINPAEHFIDGMDGDDLMYMWEIVQRSGEIDVWRFQSSADIEQSFALLGRKVPQAWSGKDATFSTGCTKEMHIALDVQKANPEMQIIGPDPKLFFRRGEYGVGKYFDASIKKH
ncbi:MAG: hypothetical protein K6G15_06525 [Desulfovibrio sp.]|nr:hypothetical protein [Desulfovibrio sp.]